MNNIHFPKVQKLKAVIKIFTASMYQYVCQTKRKNRNKHGMKLFLPIVLEYWTGIKNNRN